jgi:hypothetical protein
MKTFENFHHHNAYIKTLENGIHVFVSYYTPIALVIKNKIITSSKKYSRTTTLQKNRFISENGLKVKNIDHKQFIKLLDQYNIMKGLA